MSIQAKLLVPLLLLAACAMAVMHFIAFATLKQTLVAERIGGEQRALGLVALAIAPDLLANDLAKIHETLAEVSGQHPWWNSLTLTGVGGDRLYPLTKSEPGDGMTRLRTPVTVVGRPLGVLVVALDRDGLVAPALAVIQRLEWVVGVILALGTLVVVGLQSRTVVTPLRDLAEASHRLSRGHYDVGLPAASGDEVGDLVRAFQAMRDAVGNREAALTQSERRLAAVIDNSAEAVLSLDESGTIISLNKVAETMFGIDARQGVGSDFGRLACLDGLDASSGVEVDACRTDGSLFPAFVTTSRVEVDGGAMVVATVGDLTIRKEAEARLKESEGRFRDLAESASDWFWETDTDYRLTFVSERIGNILGVKPSAVLGFSYFDLGLGDTDPGMAQVHAGDLAALHPFRDLVFNIGPQGGKDGKIVRISGMPFFDQAGDFIGYRGIGADITREARAEQSARLAQQQLAEHHAQLERLVEERTQELKEAQREALHASRLASVGQLAAGIAHEINTPIQYIGDNLNFIQGAASAMIPLLSEARKLAEMTDAGHDFAGRFDAAGLDFLLAETLPAVEQSLDGVAQVARIVQSMKEFSHPGTTQKSAVNINSALDSTLVVSRNTWKHAAELETRFDPALPLVNCHPGEMNQVFLNLIINAAHAIEDSGKPLPGTIVVETALRGDFVEISVSDSGTGIADDIRERIFDPFFTTKEVGKGTGQGLAICYDVVVTKHGGEILVGGTVGQGAVFTIRLPV